MPKKRSKDNSEDIFRAILDDIRGALCAEIDGSEFDISIYNNYELRVKVNDKREVFVELSDGKCCVWSEFDGRGYSERYHFDQANPEFMDHVVWQVTTEVAQHVLGIFMQYMEILNTLENEKNEEKRVMNQLNYPYYANSSQGRSRLGELCRLKKHQELIVENLIEISRHAKWVRDSTDIL